MSEPTPSFLSESTAGPSERQEQSLTPEKVDGLLGDFRAWVLDQVSAGTLETEKPSEEKPVDLHTLLGQFLAVKQEVHLQTKAVRTQQEQNENMLDKLSEALEELREERAGTGTRIEELAHEQSKPLTKALMDIYDALALASKEARRVMEDVLPHLGALKQSTASLPEIPIPTGSTKSTSLLSRLFGKGSDEETPQRELLEVLRRYREHAMTEAEQSRESVARIEKLLSSLITGYEMGLQRVDRALAQQGLEPIATVGQRFDPETMEVLEAVTNTERPPGEVVEEVKRGYRQNGVALRCALVRVSATRS